jgi:hypothetical protein
MTQEMTYQNIKTPGIENEKARTQEETYAKTILLGP